MSAAVYYPSTTGRMAPRSSSTAFSPTAYLLVLQGLFYFLTGIWPLLSIDTFQRITGPKTDLWLVDTVGVLIAVIGLVMLAGVWRRQASAEVVVLAMGSALALIGIDVVFVSRGVIDRIYLLDAAVEALLVAGWIVALVIETSTRWKRSATCL